MLVTLLHLVAAQGSQCSRELARHLGVSLALTHAMLAELESQGYLRRVNGGGGQAYRSCPLRRACLFHQQATLWTLTAKGQQVLCRRGEDNTVSLLRTSYILKSLMF
jgi:DNA-binding IclR family transcriptional regulator